MKKKIIKSFIVLLLIFIIGVFFIGLNNSTIYDTKSLVGQKLVNIELDHFNKKKKITEGDFNTNNFILINFWASWCGPCRQEHPFLIKLKEENNLKLLGVNFKDKKKNALKFLNEFGNPYDVLAKDQLGKSSVNFGIYGIPESILLNKDLVVIKKFIGPISLSDYGYIKDIINK